jgi:MFS family permease
VVLRPVLRAVLPHPVAEGRRTTANLLIAGALALATPFFVLFGWLSDRIGRKKIVMAGC